MRAGSSHIPAYVESNRGGGRRRYGTALLVFISVVAMLSVVLSVYAPLCSTSSSLDRTHVTLAPSEVPSAAQVPPAQWIEAGYDGRVLVLYAYFEKDEMYKKNLEVFLAVGVTERDDVDYLIIVQGNATIQFPELRNLRVMRRPNECFDMGAWRAGLDTVTNWRDGHYRYFIFINTSVRGPFVPTYVPSSVHWTRLFTQHLHEEGLGNGPIKLVGTTISCKFRPHVQSMVWAVDLEALAHIVANTTVLGCKSNMNEAIQGGEIALSTNILSRGWNIACLLSAYQGWDFRTTNTCNNNQGPTHPGQYFTITQEIHETVFIKTNRLMHAKELEVYTQILLQKAKNGKFEKLAPSRVLRTARNSPSPCARVA